MGQLPLLMAGGFIACTLVWYFIYVRVKVSRQGAFRHFIQRFHTRESSKATLPDELREIVIERDTIVADRFDHLIKECEIIDYDPPPTVLECQAEDMFKIVANVLSRRLELDEETIFNRLKQKGKQSSTVIAQGIAIPHTVIDGTDKFGIVILRCRKGITLPNVKEPVHTLFVLLASSDELNFYLRALAAIAQIAQDKEFDDNWLKARNVEELRNILLLAERKRMI